ncbi:MAG: PAS domain S-box protein, partial [Euryarchaeota archaeon]|nr:PAS domain S-box protein [Euryarchaeota archaeon]
MFTLYKRLPLPKKLVLVGSCALILVAAAIISFAAIQTYNSSIEAGWKELDLTARYQTERVSAILISSMKTAEAFASVLAGQHQSDNPLPREQLPSSMEKILEDNPTFFGIYTMWEEDAYDGLDSQYQNVAPYAQSGRVDLYWVRDDDWIPLFTAFEEGYDDVTNEYANDYYVIPKETKQPTLSDPYLEVFLDPPVYMASISVPILEDGIFKGVVGIDFTVEGLSRIVDDIDIYDGRATMVLVANDGTVIGVTDKRDLAGETLESLASEFGVSASEFMAQLHQKDKDSFTIGNYIGVIKPVLIGNPDEYWSILVIIPKSILSESAFTLLFFLIITGIITSLCGLLLLVMAVKAITRPINELTAVAQEIAGGDLSRRVNSDGFDEIAKLGTAFDHMVSELQKTLDTIVQGEQKLMEVYIYAESKNLELESAQAELIHQNSILTALQEHLAGGLCVLDENKKVVSFNQKFLDQWNLSREELEQNPVWGYLLERITRSPQIALLSDGDAQRTLMERVTHDENYSLHDEITLADGTALERRSTPLIDQNGVHHGRIWELIDVTERVQREQSLNDAYSTLETQNEKLHIAGEELTRQFSLLWEQEAVLKKSEEKYRRIIESILDIYFQYDENYIIRLISNSAVTMLGYDSLDDLIGHPISDFLEGWEEVGPILDRSKYEPISNLLLKLKIRNGTVLECIASSNPIYVDGVFVGCEGIAKDITERKQYEKSIKEAHRKLTVLSQITRHDVLNQLTVLFSMIDVISEEICDDPSKQHLLKAMNNALTNVRQHIEFTRDYQEVGIFGAGWQDVNSSIA